MFCLGLSSFIASAIPVTLSCGKTVDLPADEVAYYMAKGNEAFGKYMMEQNTKECDKDEKETPECPPEP